VDRSPSTVEPPEDPAEDRAVTPELLTGLLAQRRAGVVVQDVAVLDESSGSANRLRLRLTYAPDTDAELPTALFLKRNLPDFAFPREMYVNEVRIYRDVVPELDVETPEIFGLAFDEERLRFTLVMTDLLSEPGARVGHVLAPVTLEEIRSLLTTLARLHAAYWDSPRLDAELSWLARPPACPNMRFWREIGPRLTERHLSRGHRAGIVDRTYWAEDRIWRGLDRMLAADDTGPRTVLHGDVHAGNVYYRAGRPGGLLDWQLALQGSWALDVTYLITSALDAGQRAAHERELLDFYLAELGARGVVAPSREEAWTRYRQNVLYGALMWFITPDGVHTEDAQLEYIARCVRAGEELDTLGALGV
jgi:aminoglycoside phosphotransferase (APT) family kinase protein